MSQSRWSRHGRWWWWCGRQVAGGSGGGGGLSGFSPVQAGECQKLVPSRDPGRVVER